MTTPDSILPQLKIVDNFAGLDKVYNSIDLFHSNRCNKNSCLELELSNLTRSEIDRIKNYMTKINSKCRMDYDGVNLAIKYFSGIHEATRSFFDIKINSYNRNSFTNGDDFTPLDSVGSTGVDLNNGGFYEPVSQYSVAGRVHPTPNAILDVNFRSETSILQFNNKLRKFNSLTSGVMLSIGVAVYNRQENEDFVAIFVVYQRNMTTGAADILHLISFGTAPVDKAIQIEFNDASGGVMTGIGVTSQPKSNNDQAVNYPPCVAPLRQDDVSDPIYLPTIPHTMLLCTDLQGLVVPIPPLATRGGDFEVNLLQLQTRINARLPAYEV
jgi:hypothetical protein